MSLFVELGTKPGLFAWSCVRREEFYLVGRGREVDEDLRAELEGEGKGQVFFSVTSSQD